MAYPARIHERGHTLPSWSDAQTTRHFTWRRTVATGVAGALALLMGYGVVFGHNGITAFQQKRAEERHLQDQTLQLQRENSRLRGHVTRLQSDPGAIEHQAREDLHYTRAGEVIYTLDPSDLGTTPPSGRK